MKEKKLQEEFCAKIGSEIKEFEQKMIKKALRRYIIERIRLMV